MDWTKIEEMVKNPFFILAAVMVVILIILLFVVIKLGVGKGALNKINLAIPGINRSLVSVNAEITKIKEETPKLTELFEKAKGELNEKVNVVLARSEYFEHAILEVLALIPNEKVKKAIETFTAQWKEKQREIKEIVGISVTEFEEQLKQRDVQIAQMSDEISKLKDLLDSALKVEESVEYGEGKEGTNN